MEDDKHYPPGAEPEIPAEVPPAKDEAPAADEPKPEGDDTKAEPGKEEPAKEEAPKDEAKPEPEPIKKPRSIYDDLKDKKQEVKTERELRQAAEARAAELEGLLAAKDTAETPAEKREAAKDIKEYAEKHGLDADGVEELANIITSKIPKPKSTLTPEEAQQWREERARAARDAEDRAISAEAPTVKKLAKELGFEIHNEAEVDTIMAEVKRLAHTQEFHDKPVDYIVFAKRAELSKLVSPKRPSFEQGGQQIDAEPDAELDFSKGGVTPEQASKVMFTKASASTEVRRSN